MSARLVLYAAALLTFCARSHGTASTAKVVINMGNNVSVDLQTYLEDLRVTAAAALFTANMNVQQVHRLQELVWRNQLECHSASAFSANSVPERTGKQRTLLPTWKLFEAPLTWKEAWKACRSRGDRLAVVRDKTEAQMLARMLEESSIWSREGNGTGEAFVGVHSLFGKNDWVTVAGESISQLVQVMSSPPAGGGAKSCGVLTALATLTEADCERPHAYVCEIPAKA